MTTGGALDRRVPGYLGRVLDDDGEPVGTCFQVAPGVLVTAWHVLDDIGAAKAGAAVGVDPLAGGEAFGAAVARVDPVHDLAVLACARSGLTVTAGPLTPTDHTARREKVTVTGHAVPADPGHRYRFLDAPGEWAGGATRDDAVPLGRMTSSAVVRGMSGAPVVRDGDGAVVGVVSSRYNSADGWLVGTVWVARTEDLLPLLDWLGDGPTMAAPSASRVLEIGQERAVANLPQGPLGDLKRLIYGLYLDAGSPSVRDIIATNKADASQDLPHRLSATMVNACIGDPTLSDWDVTLSVGSALVMLAADRLGGSDPARAGSQVDPVANQDDESAEREARPGRFASRRLPAERAERLEELFELWKAAAWDAVAVGQFGDDPRSWQTLIVARLDEHGVAAAEAAVKVWREHAPVDPAWLTWIDSLIRLTAEGRLRPVTRRPPPGAGGGSFLGRKREAAELDGFLDRVQHGRDGLALVLGPAGMGKSRLLVEVLTEWMSDTRIEWVQFDRAEAGYRGWRRLLGPLWITLRRTGLPPAALLSHVEALDEILLARAGTDPTGGPSSGEAAEAVTALLGHVAARRPLVLVIDDAHRGGTSSDHLILDVIRRLNAGSVGIIAALQPDELEDNSPIRDYVNQADGRSALDMVVPIRLSPLDPEAVAQILRKRTGVEPSPEMVKQVWRQTEGRPQLILNISSGAQWKLDPEGLLRVLEAALQSRTAEARAVLEAAAVSAVGGSVEPSVVARTAELPVDDVETILDKERQRGAILLPHTLNYSFQHDSWIDALTASCPPARRRELHARCLKLLRRDPAADPRQLAHHAIEAGVPLIGRKELVTYARKAAELAVSDYAFSTAVDLYAKALPYAVGKTRVELLIGQSDSMRFSGRWDDARNSLKLAASQARALRIPNLEAAAMIPLQRLTWSFGIDEAELTHQIRDLIDRMAPDEVTLLAQLQAMLANRLSLTARQYESEQADLGRAALGKLPQVTDPEARAAILVDLRAGLADIVPPERLLEFDDEQLELGLRIRSPYNIGEALAARVTDLIRAGRLPELPAAIRAHRDFAKRNPAPIISYFQATIDAMISLAKAEFDAAPEHTAEADRVARPWGGWMAREVVMAQTGWWLYETGQIQGLTEILEGLPAQDVSPLNDPIWRLAAGLIHAEQRNRESASGILRQVCTSTGALANIPRGPTRIGILAVAALLLGHPTLHNVLPPHEASRWGNRIASLLTAHQDAVVLVGWPALLLGSKHRYIGLAYLGAQEPDKAATHLALAIEENREFAALHIRTRFDLARARLLQSASHSEAKAELERIRQDAVIRRMTGLAAQATNELAVG